MNNFVLRSVSALAASVSIALSAQANSANVYSDGGSNLDIIGRIKININSNDASSDKRLVGTARFGVQGATEVNENLNVFGTLLYDLQAQDAASDQRIKIRYGFVGFDFKNYGKIAFGRFEDAYYKVTAPTDNKIDWADSGVSWWGLSDNDYGGRTDGQAIYDFNRDGFLLSLSYRFRDRSKNVKYAVAGTVGYEFDFGDDYGPLGFRIGANHVQGDDSGNRTASGFLTGVNKDEFGASVYWGNFGAPGWYLAAVYNHAKLQDTYKGDGFEVDASYTTPGKDWTFATVFGYLKNQDKNLDVGGRYGALSKGLTADIYYNLTAKFRIYVEYEHLWESSFSKESKSKATLGFIYNF